MPRKSKITPSVRKRVLDMFYTREDNRIITIKNELGLSIHVVSKIIEEDWEKRMSDA